MSTRRRRERENIHILGMRSGVTKVHIHGRTSQALRDELYVGQLEIIAVLPGKDVGRRGKIASTGAKRGLSAGQLRENAMHTAQPTASRPPPGRLVPCVLLG